MTGIEVAAAAAIAGTVINVAGARAQAKGQAAASRYNAAIHERNAATADISADWRKTSNDIEEQNWRDQFNALQGSYTVMANKSGVQAGTGTSLAVMLENARQADNEIAVRDLQAETDAQTYREQGINERLSGNLQRIYARNYMTAGRFKAMSAAASGGSRSAYLLGQS